MSDEPRGPYTPPRDEPLAFDARGVRDARPLPMTLIASAVVLVVLIGGVIMAYAGGGFHRKDDTPKAVGEPVASLKTPPPPGQAGPADPASRLAVFSNTTAASAAPTFTAGPEQPAERPKPQLQVQASRLPPVRIATGDETPPAKPATPAPAPAASTATPVAAAAAPVKPIRLASAAPSAPAAAKPAATTTASTAASTATVGAGGVGVQIGAFSSKELADKGIADVGKLASTAGHGKRIEPVDHGGATLYRATLTGFADRAAAKSFCETLTAKGHACIVKG